MRRIVVGMSGASGAIYGIRLLQVLKGTPDIETHLVITSAAGQTIALETDFTPRQVAALADVTYKINDIAATLSSGSYKFEIDDRHSLLHEDRGRDRVGFRRQPPDARGRRHA